MSISGSQEENFTKCTRDLKLLILQTDGFITRQMLSVCGVSEIGIVYMCQAVVPIWVQRYVQDLIKEAFQERIRKGAAQTPENK